jgi:hypothetical protein
LLLQPIPEWPETVAWWYEAVAWWYQTVAWWHEAVAWWYQTVAWWHEAVAWWYEAVAWWYQTVAWWYQTVAWWYQTVAWWLEAVAWLTLRQILTLHPIASAALSSISINCLNTSHFLLLPNKFKRTSNIFTLQMSYYWFDIFIKKLSKVLDIVFFKFQLFMKNKKSEAEKLAEQLQYFQEMFGREVVKHYKAMGLTQKEFVFKSRIPQNTVSDVENAKRKLRLDTMLLFINGLDTTFTKFFSDAIFDKGLE